MIAKYFRACISRFNMLLYSSSIRSPGHQLAEISLVFLHGHAGLILWSECFTDFAIMIARWREYRDSPYSPDFMTCAAFNIATRMRLR